MLKPKRHQDEVSSSEVTFPFLTSPIAFLRLSLAAASLTPKKLKGKALCTPLPLSLCHAWMLPRRIFSPHDLESLLVEQNNFGQPVILMPAARTRYFRPGEPRPPPKAPPAINGNGQWYSHAGDIFLCICGEF